MRGKERRETRGSLMCFPETTCGYFQTCVWDRQALERQQESDGRHTEQTFP